LRNTQKETIQAALALILGPDTAPRLRTRAVRKLACQGPDILPLFLGTLNNYPEITTPAWPWWPPQYEYCSHLLVHLCQEAHIHPATLLEHPTVQQPIGPVLWISILEASKQLPGAQYEQLLLQGLNMPWQTVRYAIATALVVQSDQGPLQPETLVTLKDLLNNHEAFPLRLTAAYALVRNGDKQGYHVLLAMLDEQIPTEMRKATLFILATEPPIHFPARLREHLMTRLLQALHHTDPDIVQYAACSLSKIAQTTTLPKLIRHLESTYTTVQIAILTILEELSHQKSFRQSIRQRNIPAHILPFCQSPDPQLRRQACYTLASCGGEYAAAALGTLVLDPHHPAHLEAIECLRQLYAVFRAPLRERVIRWLLYALQSPLQEVQVTVLDTLISLLWQVHAHQNPQVGSAMASELLSSDHIPHLFHSPSAWIRRQTSELLMLLTGKNCLLDGKERRELMSQLEYALLSDENKGVRTCIAHTAGQIQARWLIPTLLQTLHNADKQVAQVSFQALLQMITPDDVTILTIMTALAETTSGSIEARILLKKWQQLHRQAERSTLHDSE
jgi:HEAT repeat protein